MQIDLGGSECAGSRDVGEADAILHQGEPRGSPAAAEEAADDRKLIAGRSSKKIAVAQ
jgi:hypothetical protein